MSRPLVLHQVTVMDVSPADLVQLAAENGCDQVSIFTCSPQTIMPGLESPLVFPTVTEDTKQDFLQRLRDRGVTVSGVEYFPILPDIDIGAYGAPLALGRELGAERAVTHIHDQDGSRAVDRLGALCELARSHGLSVGIEFTPLTRGCTTLQRAVWLVDQVGADNLRIGVDALHLVRGGGTAQDVASVAPRYFANGQICDGHGLHVSSDYMSEVHDRELPGAGDFPLVEIFSALPADTPLEIEVPHERRARTGVSASDHVADTVRRSRALIAQLTPHR